MVMTLKSFSFRYCYRVELPTGFSYSGDFSLEGKIPECNPGYSKLSHEGPGSSRNRATMVKPGAAAVARKGLQTCIVLLCLQVFSQRLILLHHSLPLRLTRNDTSLRHTLESPRLSVLYFQNFLAFDKRKPEALQQLIRFLVCLRRSDNRNVHSEDA